VLQDVPLRIMKNSTHVTTYNISACVSGRIFLWIGRVIIWRGILIHLIYDGLISAVVCIRWRKIPTWPLKRRPVQEKAGQADETQTSDRSGKERQL